MPMKEDESSLTSGGVVSPGGFWHAACSAQPRVYEFHDNKTRLNYGRRGHLSFTSGSAEELAWCRGVFFVSPTYLDFGSLLPLLYQVR